MSFDFVIKPDSFYEVKEGSLLVSVPVYHDLLGEEYDVIEKQNRIESDWNSKLLDLTEDLAATKGMSVWEVSKLMGEAENSSSEAERFNLLGDHVTKFLKILSSRPSQTAKTYAISAAMLRRVHENTTEDSVKKLPYKFLLKLVDFATLEQMSGSYTSYEEAIAKSQILEKEVSLLRGVVDSLQEKAQGNNELRDILNQYYQAADAEGNGGFLNSTTG